MQAWLASFFGRCLQEATVGSRAPQQAPDKHSGLFTLPPDVLLLICTQLPLHNLSCLAVVSHATAERLPDEAFRAPLERCCARAQLALGAPNQHRVREPVSAEAFLMSGSPSPGSTYSSWQPSPVEDEEDNLVVWVRAASEALARDDSASLLRFETSHTPKDIRDLWSEWSSNRLP